MAITLPSGEPLPAATERAGNSVMQIGFRVAEDRPWMVLAPGTLAETLIEFNACPLPGAPQSLRQIAVVRGALLPVFDFNAWIGWPAPATARALAIGRGARAAALLVHDEPRIIEVVDGSASGVPIPAAVSDFISAARATDGTPVWRFDHQRWFAQAAHPGLAVSTVTAPHSQQVSS